MVTRVINVVVVLDVLWDKDRWRCLSSVDSVIPNNIPKIIVKVK